MRGKHGPQFVAVRYVSSRSSRAMYELNIDTWCANSSPARGRVERANLTLQGRLVKELRLRGISTVAAANAWVPAFIASYDARVAKPPRSTFDTHRPLRDDEDLDTLLTRRELRKVTKSLTVQYDRVMYLLEDTPANWKLFPGISTSGSIRTAASRSDLSPGNTMAFLLHPVEGGLSFCVSPFSISHSSWGPHCSPPVDTRRTPWLYLHALALSQGCSHRHPTNHAGTQASV